MITLELDARTTGRTRLAASPLAEAVTVLGQTVDGRPDPVHGSAGAAARAALHDRDVALVAATLQPRGRGYVPDLLTPKPASTGDVLADQLARVGATSAQDVWHQVCLERFGGGPVPSLVAAAVDDGSFARRAARGLRVFWQAVFADVWTSLRRPLDDDIAWRAQALSRHGVDGVLATIDPAVAYDGNRLELAMPYDEQGVLADTELVLSPALFGPGRVGVQFHRPDEAVLRYGARGSGRAARRTVRQGLAPLIGTTRAAVLLDLDVPRSTSELSGRLGLSAPAVSHHLTVLAGSGLVVRRRAGHHVLYERSPRGTALLT